MTALLKKVQKRVKRAFDPMPDDMTSTKYHIEQIERRRDIPADEGEIVRAATPFNGGIVRTPGYVDTGMTCPLN